MCSHHWSPLDGCNIERVESSKSDDTFHGKLIEFKFTSFKQIRVDRKGWNAVTEAFQML